MDPRLLHFYSQELQHVRDMGAEFAQRFPKIASRLAMDSTEVDDPYVERLLEGFAFLTARVQLRLSEEFPQFTEHLIQMLFPNFHAPLPAMGIAQFQPQLSDGNLHKGVRVPAGEIIQSQVIKGVSTPCKFTVCHALDLWPIRIDQVLHTSAVNNLPVQSDPALRARSALRLTMSVSTGGHWNALPIEHLDFFVSGSDEQAFKLFERLAHGTLLIYARSKGSERWKALPKSVLAPTGLDEAQAILPMTAGSFSGYRLLQEFFAFPHRYLFLRLSGLRELIAQADSDTLEFAFCFGDVSEQLDRQVGNDSLALNCTPVVNLFEHRCDRIVLNPRDHEFHLQPDRARPQDFEVYSVLGMSAYGQGAQQVAKIESLYSHSSRVDVGDICYTTRRVPTLSSGRQQREGGRSRYLGSDVYIGFSMTAQQLDQLKNVKQVAVKALCTNRDLPLLMPIDQADTDFVWPGSLPIKSIRMVRGPSKPRSPIQNGQPAWQLIQHLSLNYLSLIDARPDQGAAALRQLLSLFADPSDPAQMLVANSVKSIHAERVVRRVSQQSRLAFARGLALTLKVDEYDLQGLSLGLLGGVLAQLLGRYVSVNSFVETRLQGNSSGRVLTWPALLGSRPTL